VLDCVRIINFHIIIIIIIGISSSDMLITNQDGVMLWLCWLEGVDDGDWTDCLCEFRWVMLFVYIHIQLLRLMNEIPTVNISQHGSTHGLLAGKLAADSVAANLRQEHPVVVAAASTDARTDHAEGSMCNDLFASW